MDTCQILRDIYVTTAIVVLIMAVLKYINQRQKHNYDLRLEKERNNHEIIMHYIRKEKEKAAEGS